MTEPLDGISVVIPHYGDPDVPRAVLEQLLGQTEAPPFEVIVADDCSPIPFEALNDVRVVRSAQNGGFGSAVNTGAAEASFKYLLVLNSDVSIGPTFLGDLYREAVPLMPAIVSPNVVDEHGQAHYTARKFPRMIHHLMISLTPLARFRDRDWWHRSVGHDLTAVPGVVRRVDWVVGAVMLMPLALFREVHGFDEGFYMNSEEIDLQRRASSIGIPSYYLGTVTLEHEGGGSSASDLRRSWVVAASYRYTKKWTRYLAIHRGMLAVAAFVNLAFNCVRRVAGTDIAPFKTARQDFGLITLAAANGAPRK